MNIHDRNRTDLPIVVHNTQPSEYEALVAEYKARGGKVTVVPEDTKYRNDPALSWASGRIYERRWDENVFDENDEYTGGANVTEKEQQSLEEGFAGWVHDLDLDNPEEEKF